MRITFEDNSYVEIQRSPEQNIVLIISAKDQFNKNKNIINSVELNDSQLSQLLISINITNEHSESSK